MEKSVKKIVVVGGGSAGWLTASLLAARHNENLSITLIESPEIPTVGVGEGTWPTMRKTLNRIGLSETDFLTYCDASFKQGSRFDGWINDDADDSYFHPFAPPVSSASNHIYEAWKELRPNKSFAAAMSSQTEVCVQGLAPKQKSTPDYASALNYGYHLDAVKMAAMLSEHATKNLGVRHLRDHVIDVVGNKDEDIKSVLTKEHGEVQADLFIDCTGHASILLGGHYEIGFVDQSHVLFNDRAMAAHLPYENESGPIASQTISTAHNSGWIWDIGLPTRRGIGCVYSSTHTSDDEALVALQAYINASSPKVDIDNLNIRKLSFPTGHREKFWHKNCIAIGLSAGFLEPLEASALVLVELSAEMLAENFPSNRSMMNILAERFNDLFLYRWARIIEFLKLHYILSKRTSKYWLAHRSEDSIPQRLQDLLVLWRQQAPSRDDFLHIDEVFPAASYQYVLYGMGFETQLKRSLKPYNKNDIISQLQMVEKRARTFTAGLPTNRSLLTLLKAQKNSKSKLSERYG